jgi:hypothetical protein
LTADDRKSSKWIQFNFNPAFERVFSIRQGKRRSQLLNTLTHFNRRVKYTLRNYFGQNLVTGETLSRLSMCRLNQTNKTNMKKLIIATLGMFCAATIMVHAQDAAPAKHSKKELTPEQKQVMDDMLTKYDTDKNGKLDKTERAAMSQEDKDKMADAGLGRKKHAAAAPAADTSTNAPAADK